VTIPPEETIRVEGGRVSDDVAALAAHFRQAMDSTVPWQQTSPSTLEGRFLRRLVGALSAYEAAHGILAPADAGAGRPGRVRLGTPVERQADSSRLTAGATWR
jgi:hypothetical protein